MSWGGHGGCLAYLSSDHVGARSAGTSLYGIFEEIEWKALYCYYTKETEPPETPPTIRQAIWMVGIVGGHLGRKRDGMPGTECIWRGLQRLDTVVEMYAIFKNSLFRVYGNFIPTHSSHLALRPETNGVKCG